MAEWIQVARDSVGAAGKCLRGEHYRSAVSRAYYAMYAAVTASLLAVGLTPPAGRGTWSHRGVPDLVREHLGRQLGRGGARNVRRIVQATYKLRLLADYTSTGMVDKVTARRCVTDATAVIRKLEARL